MANRYRPGIGSQGKEARRTTGSTISIAFGVRLFATIREMAKSEKISFGEQVRRLIARGLESEKKPTP